MKYKVGDKVRVIGDLKKGWRYYMADKKTSNTAVSAMEKLKGQVVTISGRNPNGQYHVKECPCGIFGEYCWTDEMFEPVAETCNKKIVITTDGTKTLARLYEGNKVVKTAMAKCSPEDTFDFATGARLAFERLRESEETERAKPQLKYYSGKVVCTHIGTDDGYTVGKIYEFVNGTVVDDDGDVRYKFNPVFNISELQLVRFIPLVE
jgi:hypothetical protein